MTKHTHDRAAFLLIACFGLVVMFCLLWTNPAGSGAMAPAQTVQHKEKCKIDIGKALTASDSCTLAKKNYDI